MSLLPRSRRSVERQNANSVAVGGVPLSGSVMIPFVYGTIPCAWIPHLRARTHLGECFHELNIMVRERAHATGPDCSASMMAWVLFGGMSWFASMRYLPPRTPLSTQPHEANSAKGLWAGSRGGQGRTRILGLET